MDTAIEACRLVETYRGGIRALDDLDLSVDTDRAAIGIRLAALTAFVVVAAWLATRAFRSYQRSI